MATVTELNWVDYKHEEDFLDIVDGIYKGPDGVCHYFASGPRDKHIWRLVEGRIDKGLDKEEFLDNFTFICK